MVWPYCKMACQIVGTAAASVGRSARMKAQMPSAVMNGPGMCSDAPDMNAPNGIPQALTWNIGTNMRILSLSVGPVSVAAWPDSACRNVERCEYTTPFGSPVVPLV